MTQLFNLLLAGITIAFPKPNQRLPFVRECYVIGATDGGETNLAVRGRNVPVHRTGAFATVIGVQPGGNELAIGEAKVAFKVAEEPSTLSRIASAVAPRVYKKLEYAGDEPQPPPTNRAPGEVLIVLDAGHGGPTDTGALSPHALRESAVNLQLAWLTQRELEKAGYRVVMTRESDVAVPLYDRPKVAHRLHADAFVSIHHNAPPYDRNPAEIRYHAVYCWNDLGERLAKAINREMAQELGGELKSNGVIRGNLAVTRNPQIPSCLIEADFITHPQGETDSWNPLRQQRLARAIARGIAAWQTCNDL